MEYLFSCLILLFSSCLVGQEVPSVRVIYENIDAYNPLKQRPYMAQYINKVEGAEPIKGRERSTLRLYEYAGIYTIDSVRIEYSGNKAKFWRYSIISVRDYITNRRLSIYPNLAANFAYFEEGGDELIWSIDRSKTKNILGLKCYYASMKVKQDLHQIWFTTDLPYQDGPFLAGKQYGCNLPGLVMEHTMGNRFTTTAIDIEFIEGFPNLKEKLEQVQSWTKTPKPSYPPNDPNSDGVMTINTEFPLRIWTPLNYTTQEGHRGWLPN